MFFFPNGQWNFPDEFIMFVTISDARTSVPGKTGDLVEAGSRPKGFFQDVFSTGAEKGKTFPLTNIRVVGPLHLRAAFRTSKISQGIIDMTVECSGRATLRYYSRETKCERTCVSSAVQSRMERPSKPVGKNLKVGMSYGDVGVKAGGAITMGNVFVRDLDVGWEYRYALLAGGAGAAIGMSLFPKSTNFHEVKPAPPCPNWDGASVNLYTRGLDAAIVSLGSKLEIAFNLPGGGTALIIESSWIEFTMPSLSGNASTIQVGTLKESGEGCLYLGT